MIRVLVIDDHPMIRAGLTATIDPEPDMTVVASAATGQEGVELYRLHRPDVTLMDLKMPGMGGVEAIRGIRSEFPSAKIVVLSTYQGDEDIYRALDAGAVTYLLKDTLAEKMPGVIRDVAGGGRPIPPDVTRKLTDRMFQPALTNREVEVIQLLALGMRNKEVAAELHISEETAQGHVKNILAKLSVHDRTEAVAVAVRRGIVHLD
ncbi:MAG: response regulator containing a CheY-like receiver domain and an DNA-binding domain [Bryobacterales bacterium]|nr:response regulator containing a CheY-like receiver domain and an DNA-binding domain [Bryobacterales bacterium]